jgi:hydroxymethylpyrimidine kinase/phosphomethylpyrimidine kinase
MKKGADSATLPIALTIAGLDPSGGAGVIADIRTFGAFGCFATAAITSLTFQNTTGVFGAMHQTAATVRAQVLPIIADLTVSCAKTGMLPTREVIAEVARLFHESELPSPVVDPVMRATSGDDLIEDDAVSCLVSDLFPLARVVTPNIPEAERLTGKSITNEQEMRQAAKLIRAMGARTVLVKGGHLAKQKAEGSKQKAERVAGTSASPREAIDVLDDQGRITIFRDELIAGAEVHGSGCSLSAAIAACLGKGMSLEESVAAAKRFVTEAIRQSPAIGRGARPLYIDARPLTRG